jgi:hypothetical protein
MENLKKRINSIDINSPKIDDVKYISLAKYYNELKCDRDKTRYKRINLITCFYPSFIEKNDFNLIKHSIENPDNTFLKVTNNRELYAYEVVLVNKNSTVFGSFRVKDFYEYFGVK